MWAQYTQTKSLKYTFKSINDICFSLFVPPQHFRWKQSFVKKRKYNHYISSVWCFHCKTVHVFTFAFICSARTLSAFNHDSSQASAASGHDAEVKDDLLLVVLMGLWLPAVPDWAVWLPVMLSAPARFIWSLHASKEYFTLKIFLHFYIPWICNDQCVRSVVSW